MLCRNLMQRHKHFSVRWKIQYLTTSRFEETTFMTWLSFSLALNPIEQIRTILKMSLWSKGTVFAKDALWEKIKGVASTKTSSEITWRTASHAQNTVWCNIQAWILWLVMWTNKVYHQEPSRAFFCFHSFFYFIECIISLWHLCALAIKCDTAKTTIQFINQQKFLFNL